ncbi:MAG: DUF5667 domain-containing protein [Anaerolineales bacterium]
MTGQKIHPQLQEFLEALKEHTPERDLQRAAQTRAKFLAEVETGQRKKSTPWFAGILETISSVQIQWNRRLATAIASVLIAIALTFGAVGGTVYASQDSLPDQTLYALKTFTEDVQLWLADSPQEKINLLAEFTNRRVEEVSVLSEQGKEIPPATLSRLEGHTENMLQLSAEVSEENQTQSLTRIRNALQVHEKIISRLAKKETGKAGQVLARVQEKLQAKILLAEEGMADPAAFREKMKNQHPFEPGGQEKPGKPEDAGPPEDKGRPEDAGTPEDKGKPEGKGRPDHAGTPEKTGKPEDARPPEDKGKPEDPGPPEDKGKP